MDKKGEIVIGIFIAIIVLLAILIMISMCQEVLSRGKYGQRGPGDGSHDDRRGQPSALASCGFMGLEKEMDKIRIEEQVRNRLGQMHGNNQREVKELNLEQLSSIYNQKG